MDDKLKKFIEANQEAFNYEPLPEGHFERFEMKLPKASNNRRKTFTLVAFSAAACIAFLLLYKLPFGITGNEGKGNYVCEMKQEVDDIRLFYRMQMNDVVGQMEEIYEKDRTPGAAELLKETKKIQLESSKFEKEILPTLPCSDDGIFALNQHYGNSLESMQQMLAYMEQVTDDK